MRLLGNSLIYLDFVQRNYSWIISLETDRRRKENTSFDFLIDICDDSIVDILSYDVCEKQRVVRRCALLENPIASISDVYGLWMKTTTTTMKNKKKIQPGDSLTNRILNTDYSHLFSCHPMRCLTLQ